MTYKPGRLAKATVNGEPDVTVFRTGVPDNMGWEFNHADGKGHGWASDRSGAVTDVRPLVVLDLDDFAWAASVLRDPKIEAMGTRRRIAEQIEEQTRPAIEEPKGLGAVVEDDKGDKWVRTNESAGFPWRKVGAVDRVTNWAGIDAYHPVRVLSEGVPS